MVTIDFSKIRNHDGSQDNGFEELICQLAHLSPPKDADFFVRKEGAGGDAGVECYWKLRDGSEHGWQAKYFTESMGTSQWRQISESVEAALTKHPQITKYYVCLPRDWTDSRKKTKTGKDVKSAWNQWEDHVKEWTTLARDKGMEVEFTYWGKHEICQMLQQDEPKFAGRALYWFNEPIIHNQLLCDIASKSRDSLGERFTPEFHLDLPIASKLDGLGLTPEWKKRLDEYRKLSRDLADEFVRKILRKTELFTPKSDWVELGENLAKLHKQFSIHLAKDSLLENIADLNARCLVIHKQMEKCSNMLFEQRWETSKGETEGQELYTQFHKLKNKFDELDEFLQSKAVATAKSKVAVLLGEAGIGKSHLLCDISLKRLEASLPTLFLLGQHYSGGNPLELILDALDLKGKPYRQVLGALDAAGEAKNTRTLIVIDAINEGPYNKEWYENISAFLTELSNYPNLAVILSCRTTYLEYLIPEELFEQRLTRLEHRGFSGYEHRAATNYLAKQGISKPSSPITSPEFSNPLFLKTCCKALKANEYTSFPKGLNGISKLFNFYLDSVAKIINRKKKYSPNEEVVKNAIYGFAKHLYPDNLPGIPTTDARGIVDSFDPKPQIGDSLTDLLIDEGVLSFDIIPNLEGDRKGREVVRFTYERFSDHFIAQYILDKHVINDDVASIFSEDQLIGKMLKEHTMYKHGGIIEALGICIPEQYKCEFMEFVSEDSPEYKWLLQKTFTDVVLWRAPDSFTQKTIKLLNQITTSDIHQVSLDILLSLSTEPNHPWNADFLDRNLLQRSLPKRDAFWSTHIAISDWSEDKGQGESALRTLIDWALLANLEDVEEERLRLTALTLTWITTTSNRRVRDQATKSLSRVLHKSLALVPRFIEKFRDSDDPYLVERLYAAIYGAISNSEDYKMVQKVAETVFQHIFHGGQPFPHILVRDYARGIMELAYAKGLLSSDISPDMFRPPYKSSWPIENPSEKEIIRLAGDEYSGIKNSLMGFPGDFGNYTMNCIHNWSPTPLTEEKPESSLQIQYKFANSLPDKIRDKYIKYLDEAVSSSRNSNFDIEAFLNSLEEIGEDIDVEEGVEEVDTWKELEEQIKEVLDDEQKEYFRWASGLGINERPATFSRKWAQRWVCKKAYELGWEPKLFEDFERFYSRRYGREGGHIERIGKKYQWIAFHELLARISDNLHWLDRGYSDVDDSIFFGPWQIYVRDIDPTIWMRKVGSNSWDEQHDTFWWQPFIYQFVDDELEQQQSWLWDRNNIPPFTELIRRKNPEDEKDWLILKGFASWNKKPERNGYVIPTQDGWFRINSCIIHKKDLRKLKGSVSGKNLCDPHILNFGSTDHQGFIKEYPWHPSCKELRDWIGSSGNWPKFINVKHLVPVCKYEWESGSKDHSIDESISMYLPSRVLISELELSSKPCEPALWLDRNGELGFVDPSGKGSGLSYGIIRADLIKPWLEKNDFQIVWLVGGEKQLFTNMASKFFGRLIYSGIFTEVNNEIKGDVWFIEESRHI